MNTMQVGMKESGATLEASVAQDDHDYSPGK